MDRYQRLIEKLEKCEKVQGSNIAFVNEPLIIQKMLRDDIDFYLLDMEHGRFSTENLLGLFAMCRALCMPSIVRVQDTAYHLIAKTLDMGADGIMLPRLETKAQLKQAIDAMFYPPIGRKGYGGLGHLRAGETLEQYQKSRVFLPQIESPTGIANLEEMLDAYGQHISGVIIGPADLSITSGTPLDTLSDVMEKSVQKVFDICKQRGKSVGIYCNDAKGAKHYCAMGANILWVAGEMDFLLKGYNAVYDELATIQ